jgi:hypothetical protein
MSPGSRSFRIGRLATGLLFFAAPTAWIVFQQGLGGASYFDCTVARPPWGVAVGVVATLACAAIALLCWRERLRAAATRRFLMVVAAGAAGVFAAAVLAMTFALALVPACAR